MSIYIDGRRNLVGAKVNKVMTSDFFFFPLGKNKLKCSNKKKTNSLFPHKNIFEIEKKYIHRGTKMSNSPKQKQKMCVCVSSKEEMALL